ncbi:MAG: sigma-54-dependent Fis family transcriptional regulator [Deltaproteobacteria bacterium]|nr:sigma-54-dependent Fis family transcriptional regulator [Deltaproteobacteria bacterium]
MSDKILIVDDEPSNRKILAQELVHRGYAVDTARGGREALAMIESALPDLAIVDFMMPDLSGLEVLKELHQKNNDTPVIMITAYGSVERAVEAMKAGAYDFITRPFDPDHIDLVLRKALERQTLKRKVEVLADENRDRYHLIVGESAKMKLAVEMAHKAAASNSTVLLLGESGTGKELFARFIHNHSERANRPFIAINSVGLSKELLESDLFGHEQGAFTGALKMKKGKIEVANGGTIFFDEIGDVSREMQAKLLRFLQEREFERVGGVTPISVDVRVIAATNRDIGAAVKSGEFRDDLYHRLNVVAITPPPLRERKEDIPILTEYFLRKFAAATQRNVTAISDGAMAKLSSWAWPGNVRELANAIERAVVLGLGTTINASDLPSNLAGQAATATAEGISYHEGVNAARKRLVVTALQKTNGNRAAAARLLGLESKYFLRLMKSLGIE